MVSVGDQRESDFLKRHLGSIVSDVYWLGLYRNSSGENSNEGWFWVDGTPLNFSNWGSDEPNNWRNNEKCGELLGKSGYWNDISCYEPRLSLCERKKGKYLYLLLQTFYF